MKKLLSLTLALCLLLSCLVGCGNDSSAVSSAASGTEPAASGEPAAAANDSFLKIAVSTPDIVDPQCTTEYYVVALNIFDRLVEVKAGSDGTSEIVPSLAKSWEISDDGLTYTFHLE